LRLFFKERRQPPFFEFVDDCQVGSGFIDGCISNVLSATKIQPSPAGTLRVLPAFPPLTAGYYHSSRVAGLRQHQHGHFLHSGHYL
jgi:hypothetical protein